MWTCCVQTEVLTQLAGFLQSETDRGEHLNIFHTPAERVRGIAEGGPRTYRSLSLGGGIHLREIATGQGPYRVYMALQMSLGEWRQSVTGRNQDAIVDVSVDR